MTAFITQYKILFLLSWVIFYLIFPAWALPISVTARALVFSGFILYFCISAWVMNRWFDALTIDKPVIVRPINITEHIKNNLWLVIVCFIAVILHIYPIFLPILIIGDETLHLQNGLLIYEYIDSSRHVFFQIAFWVFIVLIVIISKVKWGDNSVMEKVKKGIFKYTSNNLFKYNFIFLFIIFLFLYFFLLRNLAYTLTIVRYPPVSKFLYFFAYSAFGINHIFPRTIQLIFYLLCAIYLFRTINLFYGKETALLGASIYLFLPVTFAYAYLGEIESGVIFFIVAISFYFLRCLKEGDNRDLLLSVYMIGIGYLYKDPVFLIFPVCMAILIYQEIKKRTLYLSVQIKILLLAMVPVIPWMIIEKLYSWRSYTFQLSNITSLDKKILPYFLLMSSNVSEIIFIFFVLSVIYCFIKRNTLTVYLGLLFIVYYFFIVSDMGVLSPRFSMALYPTITVFISVFFSEIIQLIKWRHAFKLCFIVIIVYLIIISSVSPLNSRYLAIENKKLYYYPSEQAMKWVKENVKAGEKVLAVRILSSTFYRYKYAISRDKMIDIVYDMEKVSTPEKLKKIYKEHNISYLMFPYSTSYIKNDVWAGIFEYLKNNPNKEFDEIEKFNLDDKYIFIYKLKEI